MPGSTRPRAGSSTRPTSADTRTSNARRLPAFARLDLRATFWPGGAAGRWLIYLDVINATNRDNAGPSMSEPQHDPLPTGPASSVERTGAIPFLPSVGVRFRF